MAEPARCDEDLLRELYEEHGGPLLAYAERLVGGDRQQAEDIVQETLLRAWRHSRLLASEWADSHRHGGSPRRPGADGLRE